MKTNKKVNIEKAQEAEVTNVDKELDKSIDPEDIIIEDDDSDMPTPESKVYDTKKYVKCTETFMKLFNNTVGVLPYATILKNQDGDQIKLIDVVKYVETKKDCIALDEMNRIVSFIANLEFKYARPLMEVIENKSMHKDLWELV